MFKRVEGDADIRVPNIACSSYLLAKNSSCTSEVYAVVFHSANQDLRKFIVTFWMTDINVHWYSCLIIQLPRTGSMIITIFDTAR